MNIDYVFQVLVCSSSISITVASLAVSCFADSCQHILEVACTICSQAYEQNTYITPLQSVQIKPFVLVIKDISWIPAWSVKYNK